MNILLAARDLSAIGGVQTYVDTVARELRRRGHRAIERHDFSQSEWPHIDLGIFAHGSETSAGFDLCDRVLLVSHGIIEQERPVPGADAYAFVSEECFQHWSTEADDETAIAIACSQPQADGFVYPIIRQPIDTEFWSPGRCWVDETPTDAYILRYSYYGGLPWLPEVCRDLGYDFHHVKDADPETAREWIRGAACVISSGRGALEAMSCGRPTVICDDRPYRGARIGGQAHNSYAGGSIPACDHALANEVRAAVGPGEWGVKNRDYILEHHDVRKITDQLLEAGGVA